MEKKHLASDPANTCPKNKTNVKSKKRPSKNDVQRRKETATHFQYCSEHFKDFVQLLPYLLDHVEGNTVIAVHDRPARERTWLC